MVKIADLTGGLDPADARVKNISKPVQARLIAQEYVRNGMDLNKAFQTVTHKPPKNRPISRLVGDMDQFIDELRLCLNRADINKERALTFLWSIIQSSILDFFDDTGRMLPVAEMKKLPRVLQQLIHKIDVRTVEFVLTDKDKNPILDDLGRVQKGMKQEVTIEMPHKLEAIKQLAQIMRWVGPNTVINNNLIGIGTLMAHLDTKRQNLEDAYQRSERSDVRALPASGDA